MQPALVVGARSIYEIVDSSDMADLIGIVFAPGGFTPFANDSAHLFSNQSVALFDIWGSQANSLRDQLRDLPTPQARLCCLEQFLRSCFAARIAHSVFALPAEIDFAIHQFERIPNVASVRETARKIGWSERRFSQVFREAVGLTPKVWCRIQRFQRAVHQLHAGADIRWAELALDCGYYDQSHFANEFRAFSGVDATTYSANRTRWANHIAAE
jgi:AraC-like DNA-binding protein